MLFFKYFYLFKTNNEYDNKFKGTGTEMQLLLQNFKANKRKRINLLKN